MKILEGCIAHTETATLRGTRYEWPNPDYPARSGERTVCTYNPMCVPLSLETRQKLDAAWDSHAIAVEEAGFAECGENYMTRAAYHAAFDREMAQRGFPPEG